MPCCRMRPRHACPRRAFPARHARTASPRARHCQPRTQLSSGAAIAAAGVAQGRPMPGAVPGCTGAVQRRAGAMRWPRPRRAVAPGDAGRGGARHALQSGRDLAGHALRSGRGTGGSQARRALHSVGGPGPARHALQSGRGTGGTGAAHSELRLRNGRKPGAVRPMVRLRNGHKPDGRTALWPTGSGCEPDEAARPMPA